MKNDKHKNVYDQSWQGNVGKLVDSLRIPLLLLSHWVVSGSSRPHGLPHTHLPCPSTSQSLLKFMSIDAIWLSHPLSPPSPFASFPTLGSFLISQLFVSVGQSNGASASASILPMNIQGWYHLGWTGWISLQSKGLSRVFSNSTVQKHQSFGIQPSLWSNFHIHTWLLEKS